MFKPNIFAFAITCSCIALLFSGCAEINQTVKELTSSLNTSLESGEEKFESGQTPINTPRKDAPVRVTMDGHREISDEHGIYWDIKEPVSANPEVVFRIDSSLGDFDSLFIQMHRTNDQGTEEGQPWAINDFGKDKVFQPGEPFTLTNPGDVNILSPDGQMLDSVTLESGETYVALFVVKGTSNNHTHKVRFTVE